MDRIRDARFGVADDSHARPVECRERVRDAGIEPERRLADLLEPAECRLALVGEQELGAY